MTLFVLEGCDLTGKSTLARQLQAEHIYRRTHTLYEDMPSFAQIIRQGPPTHDDIFEQYLRPLDNIVANCREEAIPDTWIFDRWHVGELIYGPMLRGKSRLTQQQAHYIDMVLQSLGAICIITVADLATLHDRYDIRGDTLIQREWLNDISSAYWWYLAHNRYWVPQVVGGPRRYTYHNRPLILPGRYIGPESPCVLLLGDKRANTKWSWPFVPYRPTSGHWLLEALSAADVDHMSVGLLNVSETDAAELHLLYGQLGWPPVVTLGRNAERAWQASWCGQTRPYTYLNHPQHERRFNYTNVLEYGQTIKDVIMKG